MQGVGRHFKTGSWRYGVLGRKIEGGRPKTMKEMQAVSQGSEVKLAGSLSRVFLLRSAVAAQQGLAKKGTGLVLTTSK